MLTLPGIGAITWTGFEHRWSFLFALVPLGLLVLYVAAQVRRRRRVARFVGDEPRDSARSRPVRWRHVPLGLTLVGLVLLTVALAGPTRDVRIPRNRAVIMLVVDVSQSMRATDVDPTRLAAAQKAAKQFASGLTPGINLGVVAFAGNADLLVAPNPDHRATVNALDKLQTADQTATGEAIFTALQSIATVGAVLSSDGDTTPPPARIVLLSDGFNTVGRKVADAADAAKKANTPVSTIAFGTDNGTVAVEGRDIPVPVNKAALAAVADATGGHAFEATTAAGLRKVYADIGSSIGFKTEQREITSWFVGLALVFALAAAAGSLLWTSRLP